MSEPSILYHASPIKGLRRLIPSDRSPRYPSEVPLVFATPYKAVAAMFLAPKDAGPAHIGKYGDQYILVIQSTLDDYEARDHGGVIYTAAAHEFHTQSDIGMGTVEWVSKKPVDVIGSFVYSSAARALQETGVKLYLVDARTFELITSSSDGGLNIIQGLDTERYEYR